MKTIKKKLPQILRYDEAPKVVARLNVGKIHAKRSSFVGFVFLSYISFVILESRGDRFPQWNGEISAQCYLDITYETFN